MSHAFNILNCILVLCEVITNMLKSWTGYFIGRAKYANSAFVFQNASVLIIFIYIYITVYVHVLSTVCLKVVHVYTSSICGK